LVKIGKKWAIILRGTGFSKQAVLVKNAQISLEKQILLYLKNENNWK